MADVKGIWGNQSILQPVVYEKVKSRLTGWLLRKTWRQLETAPGVFDWPALDDDAEQLEADDKALGIAVTVSPASAATPEWLFDAPYNVPKVITTTNSYPYYLDAVFIERKEMFRDALLQHIAQQAWKDRVLFVQSMDGSTGDYFPYKGTITSVQINGSPELFPNDTDAYAIANSDWIDYKRTEIYTQFYNDIAEVLPGTVMMINPANDGTDWQYCLDNLPGTAMKQGRLSHNYNDLNERYTLERIIATQSLTPPVIIKGETEDLDAWFLDNKKQNLFAMICSAIMHGLTNMQYMLAVIDGLVDVDSEDDLWIFDFANRHMGVTDPADTNKAFIAFRKIIDGADTATYDEDEYGPLIALADQASYNYQLNLINASDDPETVKSERRATLIATLFNEDRAAALQDAFPLASIPMPDPSDAHDAFASDIVINGIPGNYQKYIEQYSPDTTSIGLWRQTTGGFHGRFARSFDHANGKSEIFLLINESIAGNGSYKVNVLLTFLDISGCTFRVYYYNGEVKTSAAQISTAGTGLWITETITINDFHGGGNLANGSDLTLKYTTGNDAVFSLLEFEVTEINSTEMPSSYKVRSDYFETIANTNKLIAHARPIAGSDRTRQTFFRVNNEDEMNAACVNWIHFPCVVHTGHNIKFTQPGTGLPRRVHGNTLLFLSKAINSGNLSDNIEDAYESSENAMTQFLAYMLNDLETNGACGSLFFV